MRLFLYGHRFCCVYICVHIVPIAAGFQIGILETSTEEVTRKKIRQTEIRIHETGERNTGDKLLQKKLKHQKDFKGLKTKNMKTLISCGVVVQDSRKILKKNFFKKGLNSPINFFLFTHYCLTFMRRLACV